MRIALDSNVIIYAEGLTDDDKRSKALRLVDAIPAADLLIPIQSAGETLRWLVYKAKIPKLEAFERAARWLAKYPVQDTTSAVFAGAGELAAKHDFQVWDAIILASAAEGAAAVLLSEDMQLGFTWRGVTIVNPFSTSPPRSVGDNIDGKP